MPDGIPGQGVMKRRKVERITARIDWLRLRISQEDPRKPRNFDRAEIAALMFALQCIKTVHPDVDIPKEYQS